MKFSFFHVIRTRIFNKLLILYIFLLILNLGLSVIIILYNQTSLVSRVEVQDKYLQNIKYKENLLDDLSSRLKKETDLVFIKTVLEKFLKGHSGFVKDIYLFDAEGQKLISFTDDNPGHSGNNIHLDKRLVLKLIFKHRLDKTDYLFEIEANRILLSYMVFPIGEDIYILKMSQTIEAFSHLSRVLFSQIIAVFIISLLIHSLFSIVVYRNIIYPIRMLNQSVKEIIHGNLDDKITIAGNDEIGDLSISFNEMIVAVQNLRSDALDSNPLTGLPGNNVIMKRIQDRIDSGDQFAFAYIDMDNFKPYNDKFGFNTGDKAIMMLGDILKGMKQKYGEIFIGHIGGDDFVYISNIEDYEIIGNEILNGFSEKSRSLFSASVLKNGYYISKTRNGEIQKFGLLSISIGVVTNRYRSYRSYAELIQEAAEMKKYAKSYVGNTIKVDKRETDS